MDMAHSSRILLILCLFLEIGTYAFTGISSFRLRFVNSYTDKLTHSRPTPSNARNHHLPIGSPLQSVANDVWIPAILCLHCIY